MHIYLYIHIAQNRYFLGKNLPPFLAAFACVRVFQGEGKEGREGEWGGAFQQTIFTVSNLHVQHILYCSGWEGGFVGVRCSCIHSHTHTHTHTHVRTHSHIHVCVCVCTYVPKRSRVILGHFASFVLCKQAHLNTHRHTHTNIHTYRKTNTRITIHTHIHTYRQTHSRTYTHT